MKITIGTKRSPVKILPYRELCIKKLNQLYDGGVFFHAGADKASIYFGTCANRELTKLISLIGFWTTIDDDHGYVGFHGKDSYISQDDDFAGLYGFLNQLSSLDDIKITE